MEQGVPLKKQVAGRFRGALIGVGIGNALAFPHAKNSRSYMQAMGDAIVKKYEAHRSGYFPKGQYSEETQLLLLACESYAEQGALDLDDVSLRIADLWRDNAVVGRSEALTAAARALVRHDDPPRDDIESGEGLTLAIAAGLWNHDEPERLVEETTALVGSVRSRPSVLAAACAIASATAFCLTHREVLLGELVDQVAAAAEAHDAEFADQLRELPRSLATPEPEALRRIHEWSARGPGSAAEDTLLVLYSFLRTPEDFSSVVRHVLRFGDRASLRGALAGGLSGAFVSASRLPADLVEGLLHVSHLKDLSGALYEAKSRSFG